MKSANKPRPLTVHPYSPSWDRTGSGQTRTGLVSLRLSKVYWEESREKSPEGEMDCL